MNKSIRKVFLCLCLLFFALPLHANSILVLGDSISAAFGMDPKQGWVSLLEAKLNANGHADYQVINASVSGNTTGDGLARLPALLNQHQPSIVILELGGNDGLRGYPVKLMKRNLQHMIDQSQAIGAKVVLAGIEIPPNYGQRYTDSFRQSFQTIADNNDVTFLPFILKDVATNTALMQDDLIHPTAEAQPILLDTIWVHLESML